MMSTVRTADSAIPPATGSACSRSKQAIGCTGRLARSSSTPLDRYSTGPPRSPGQAASEATGPTGITRVDGQHGWAERASRAGARLRAVTRSAFDRVRAITLALPEVNERHSHAEPCFFIRDRRPLCYFHDDHNGDGRVTLWCPGGRGARAELVARDPTDSSDRLLRPPVSSTTGSASTSTHHVRPKPTRARSPRSSRTPTVSSHREPWSGCSTNADKCHAGAPTTPSPCRGFAIGTHTPLRSRFPFGLICRW